MAKKTFKLQAGKYDPTFIKALAMCIHLELLEPAELEFWQENDHRQGDMSKELYNRIKNHRAQFEDQPYED